MNKRRQPFVFPTDSEIVRNRNVMPRNNEQDANRKYQQYSRNYVSQDFTYECHQFIQNICGSIKQDTALARLPVSNILIAVSKKLFLNELEFLFLSCLLDELKWPIYDETIKNHASTLRNLTADLPDRFECKCMELYLLLAAYSVKVYLNEDIKIFENQMNDLLPKFQQIFQTWGNKFAKTALIINPKKLNIKFMNFTYKGDDRVVHHEDLNSKVNELLENAPSLQGPRRPRKGKSEHTLQPEVSQQSPEEHQLPSNHDNQEEEINNLPPPPIIQQQSSLGLGQSQMDLPTIAWPFSGESFYGGYLNRHSSGIDYFNLTLNPPGLTRMDSAGSEFNFAAMNLRTQPSIDRDPPAN